MKKTKLGTLNSNGKLIVSDPCYEDLKDSLVLKNVKHGNFNIFLINGKMKKPFFKWDEVKENTRNARLIIQHESYKNEKPTKVNSISVDSGQAGFFNFESYRKDSSEPIMLKNNLYSFIRDCITEEVLKIEKNNIMIKEKNKLYFDLIKIWKCSEEDFTLKIKKENKDLEKSIKENRAILKSKKYPDYLKTEQSSDFYDIICDLNKGKYFAGVNNYGTVAQSGIGDGYYSVYIAKNKKGEIIYAHIDFLNLTDMK